ncbi:MAG: CRISPR-associated endonuclease Cas3'', partial [Candidimonas sp.]
MWLQDRDLKRHIAHVRQADNAHQALRAHLGQVGEIASRLASKLDLANAGALIGLMHDFGKYSQAFQRYIRSATGRIDADADDFVDAKALKGKIDHSSAGAQWVYQQLAGLGNAGRATGLGELCGQILALCIASHHSGLIDCLAIRGDQAFQQRMRKTEEKTFLQECISAADRDITEKAQALAGVELIRELAAAIQRVADFSSYPKDLSKLSYFNLGFLVRFLFSCLIDADRLDSAEFEDPRKRNERLGRQGIPDWQVAMNRLEARLSAFPLGNEVDGLRRDISNWCYQRASDAQGIYTLTVPTGGGKTYASLRYALRHACMHKLERIIYIIPYTSIIEQNAEVIRDAVEQVGDARPWVLEHHSNLEPEKQTWRTKLVSENWDAPIVLTTMVQFLEALFDGGTRSVRRLHQLANSVLIFDEIQTLPVNCVHLFCNALNFLTTHAKTTAVLCTATQPLLNQLKAPEKGQLYIPDSNELVQDKYK